MISAIFEMSVDMARSFLRVGTYSRTDSYAACPAGERFSTPRKVGRLAGREKLEREDVLGVLEDSGRLAGGDEAHADDVLVPAVGGDRLDRRGHAERPVLGHEREVAVYWAPAKPQKRPAGPGTRKGGSPSL